jgi:hypothetical protein
VRILGADAEIDPEGLGRIQMTAADLEGNFDYIPLSPVSPQDPARQVAVWQGVLSTASTIPQLMAPDPTTGMYLDMNELFKHICRLGGAKEIDSMFKMATPQMMGVQVMPDDQIAQQQQQGNIAPMGQGGMPQ